MSSTPSIVPEFSDGGGDSSGVQTVNAGTNITVTGPSTDPVINNNGVLSVRPGTNITITGSANDPIINASISSSPVAILSTATTVNNSLTTSEQTILTLTFTLTQTSNIFVCGGLGLISTSTTAARVIMGFSFSDASPVPNTTVSQTIQLNGVGTAYERVSTTGFTNKPAGTYTLRLRAYAAGVPSGTVTLDTGNNTMQILINLA